MRRRFDLNSNVGGACGEIVALKGKYFSNLYVLCRLRERREELMRGAQAQPARGGAELRVQDLECVSLSSTSSFGWSLICFPAVDILDKPLESGFGYITVLPGAFSACESLLL